MVAASATPLVAGVRLKHRGQILEDQSPNCNLPHVAGRRDARHGPIIAAGRGLVTNEPLADLEVHTPSASTWPRLTPPSGRQGGLTGARLAT